MGILEIPKSPSYCLTDKVKRRLLWNPFPHVFPLSHHLFPYVFPTYQNFGYIYRAEPKKRLSRIFLRNSLACASGWA